jgi:hypothetical protein
MKVNKNEEKSSPNKGPVLETAKTTKLNDRLKMFENKSKQENNSNKPVMLLNAPTSFVGLTKVNQVLHKNEQQQPMKIITEASKNEEQLEPVKDYKESVKREEKEIPKSPTDSKAVQDKYKLMNRMMSGKEKFKKLVSDKNVEKKSSEKVMNLAGTLEAKLMQMQSHYNDKAEKEIGKILNDDGEEKKEKKPIFLLHQDNDIQRLDDDKIKEDLLLHNFGAHPGLNYFGASKEQETCPKIPKKEFEEIIMEKPIRKTVRKAHRNTFQDRKDE